MQRTNMGKQWRRDGQKTQKQTRKEEMNLLTSAFNSTVENERDADVIGEHGLGMLSERRYECRNN